MIPLYKVKTRDDFVIFTARISTLIINARRALAEAATDNSWENRSDSLMDQVQTIAMYEEQRVVAKYIIGAFESSPEASGEAIWTELALELGLQHSDDSWSGRGNDLKRVQRDARIDFIRELKYVLKSL